MSIRIVGLFNDFLVFLKFNHEISRNNWIIIYSSSLALSLWMTLLHKKSRMQVMSRVIVLWKDSHAWLHEISNFTWNYFICRFSRQSLCLACFGHFEISNSKEIIDYERKNKISSINVKGALNFITINDHTHA